jgi:hypothetical protein
MKTELKVDARKITKDITVTVQIKNMVWVRVGMFFLKIGCLVGGFTLVDEFPMSLIQPDGNNLESVNREAIEVRKP